mmetsp:Transcript_22725/g.34370  ORF Transcript_22725/g.34370 Transcript_22725/m.34370 type:complete len:720 (+) Transcript_22725:140-2299(+)
MSSKSSTFIRDYSKAIAEALHDKEQDQTTISVDDQVRDAYTALCFDDPIVSSDEACRLLSKFLLKGDYAISERLVEGIRQATGRYEQSLSPAIDKIENEKSLRTETIGSATAVGYAILAKTVFLDIPFKCCQESDLRTVQKLLGSFRGPRTVDTEDQDKVENLISKDFQISDDPLKHAGANNEEAVVNNNCAYDYDEVWAEESDPSDFFYESSAQQIDWSAWEDTSFDPQKLSKPVETDDWPDVQQAISNLLRDLSHSKFVPIDATLWKHLDLSDALTQLTLTLLVENNNLNPMLDHLRQWSVQPLNVMRDRILMASNPSLTGSTNTTVLKDYLSLVQSLIAVDALQPDNVTETSAASVVGLVNLSSICTQGKNLKEMSTIRKCVIECCEDLGSLVERTTTHIAVEREQGTLPSWVRLIWALLPVLEVISNIITEDGSELDSSANRKTLATADAQWLLNSGLFRQLILFYLKTEKFSGTTVDLARRRLLQTLQFLSLKSMTLLGKYAWRVPELNKAIHQSNFVEENNLVDNLLWSLMGIELAAGGSILRTRNAPILTPDSCRETALKQFHKVCQNVVLSLQVIEKHRQRSEKDQNDPNVLSKWKEPIDDFRRFSNCLTSCPVLPGLFKQVFTDEILHEEMQLIKKALTDLSSTTSSFSASDISTTVSKTAENDKAGEPTERPDNTFENSVTMVHKSVKTIIMACEDTSIGHAQLSSKLD